MTRKTWMETTVYAVGVIFLTLLDMASSAMPWQIPYLLAVAVVGTLAIRGRIPDWAIGLISAAATIAFVLIRYSSGTLGSFGLGECFILLILVVTSSRSVSRPIDWARVVLLLAALLCVPLRVGSYDILYFLILLVAAAGCALAAGAVLRNMDSERRLALAVAMRNERDGLARDLHDDFTNRVTGIVLMVQALRRTPDAPRADIYEELARVEAAGAEALGSMRRWVATLRSSDVELNPELDAIPVSDVSVLAARWEATSRTGRARFVDNTDGTIPAGVQTTIYRIVQEAVTDVSRHAPNAEWLDVSLTQSDDALVIRVSNPLAEVRGIDPVPGSAGLGIMGMKERAAAVGGTVDAGPAASSTWSVAASIPLVDPR